MSKAFRPYDSDQIFLMPASMRDWLPSGHLAYFISDLVDHLNLSAIMSRYEQEERGYPPYHPAMMVKVLLYAYCGGAPSSRKIARKLEEDIAFRVLVANNTPEFRTTSDFRKDHLKALCHRILFRAMRADPLPRRQLRLNNSESCWMKFNKRSICESHASGRQNGII